MPPVIIFCAFTRRWAVDKWLEALDTLTYDKSLISLAFIVDMDAPGIMRKLEKFAADKGYAGIATRLNQDNQPNEVRLSVRRARIAEVKNQSRDLVNQLTGDYVIGLEDDTVIMQPDTIERLIKPMVESNLTGFVQGVQVGRWGARMIGAWKAYHSVNNPTQLRSMNYKEDGYDRISAGGFYGYATTRHLYINHEYYTSTAQPWGPDVNYGLWVLQRGYVCLIDWSIVFGHNDHGKILFPDEGVDIVEFNKDLQTGRWDRMDVEKAR